MMGTSELTVWISWTVSSVGSSSTNQLPPWVPPRMSRSTPPPRTSSMASSAPAGSRAVPSSRVMVKTMAALYRSPRTASAVMVMPLSVSLAPTG